MVSKAVLIEVANMCNGRCKYCATGRGAHKRTGFISVPLFLKILDKAISYNFIDKDSIIYLYNWGEAFLHPKLNKLVEILNDYNLYYGFSTNASVVPKIDENFCKNLKRLAFSMCGFSQESYDRIHQFDFKEIYKNIYQIVSEVKKYNDSVEVILTYHVYRFNKEEVVKAYEFAQDLGIEFHPNYALINDWDMASRYFSGLLPESLRQDIEKDLWMPVYTNQVESSITMKLPCFYNDNPLVIDELGNVAQCCLLPNTHPNYSCGNLFVDSLEYILEKKKSNEICKSCTENAIYQGFNTHVYRGYE